MSVKGPRKWIRWSGAALVVGFFLASITVVWDRETGLTEFIRFGDLFAPRAVPALSEIPHYTHADSAGYDAQFYAQMALDPLLREEATAAAMDGPGYRFRRVLMGWVAWVAGRGQPTRVLGVFAWINVLSWLALAGLLLRWVRPTGLDGLARWAACLLGLGTVASVTHAMPDLPATVLILAAVALLERGHTLGAGASLALAALTRETALLAGILRPDGIGGGLREWRARIVFGLVAIAPLALWMAYLKTLGYPPNGGSPHNFALPFVGLWGELRETVQLASEHHYYNLLALVSLLVQGLGLLVHAQPRSALWRVGGIHLLLLLVLGRSVWEGDPGATYRVLLPLTIAFNLCLPRDAAGKWGWLLAGNLSALVGFDYLARYF